VGTERGIWLARKVRRAEETAMWKGCCRSMGDRYREDEAKDDRG
jgi:hypothetical protein